MKRIDFENGTVTNNILSAALPMLVAQILNLLYNIVDRIYIARIHDIGTTALGAVGLCFPIIMIITAFSNLFGSGGAPIFSINRGKGDSRTADMIMNTAFTMLCGSAAVLMLIGFLFARPLLTLFGASDDALVYAYPYLMIYLLGTLPSMIATGMNPFINAQGYAIIGMLSVTVGAVANIILDPIFIFGLHMGVRGAALATIISQICSGIWVLRFLTGKKVTLRLNRLAMVIEWARVKEIMALGISGFMMQFTNGLVQIFCNSTLHIYGGDIYVGVMTVLNSVRDIATMMVHGLTNGASPVMSFNYGEKAFGKVKQAIKFVTVVCFSYALFVWGIIKIMPEFFIKLFNNDPTLLEKGVPALHIYFFGFCFMALQFTGQAVFVALGKAKRATFFSIFRKVIIVVPLTVLLPRVGGLGVDGVFWAEPISNLIGGCACFFTMLATILPELKEK